jgi:hypothetical protein
VRNFGGSELEYVVGPFDPNDASAYSIVEVDAAQNASPRSAPLRVVPPLVGLTLEQATTALTQRGFVVGKITQTDGGTAAPGTIVGPAGLTLAEQGATVDLQVAAGSSGGAATKLIMSVVGTKRFSWAQRTYLAARVQVTRASNLTVTLLGPTGQRLYRWRMHVKAGTTIVKLKMPKQVRRPGRYTLVFVAVSGNDTTRTVVPVQIVKSGKGLGKEVHPNAQPVDVVLAGAAIPKGIALGIDDPQTRVIQAADQNGTFAATASSSKNVQVVVVDADQYGLGFVHDLRTVFPSVKLVAITDDPRKLAAAIKAGATVALPRSTPADQMARVIAKLASGH